MRKLLGIVWQYSWLIDQKKLGELLQPVIFFVMISAMFSMVLDDQQLIRSASPAILSISIALSTLYAVDQLFHTEYRCGTLIDLILSPYPLPTVVLFRLLYLIVWVVLSTSVVLIPIAYILQFPTQSYLNLLVFGASSAMYFCLIGSVGCALTVNTQKSGLVLSLVILPLSIPMLLASIGFLSQITYHQSGLGALYFMLFLDTLFLTLAPFFISAILKLHAAYLPNH